MNDELFYNWNILLSYNARLYIVVGARGIGKTFGLRLHCVKHCLKHEKHYIEIVRYKNQIPQFMKAYFEKLSNIDYLKKYEFKTVGESGYCRKIVKGKNKNKWYEIMRCVALTDAQKIKMMTFWETGDVYAIIFDEFILDKKMQQYYRYLNDEISIFQNVIDSITRENVATEEKDRTKIFLIGNALDSFNPYFIKFNLYENLQIGKIKRFANGAGVFHYVKPSEEFKDAKKRTTSFLFSENDESEIAANNLFVNTLNKDFICKKSSDARCLCNLVDVNKNYSVWLDIRENLAYITDKRIDDKPFIALSIESGKTDNIIANRKNKVLKLLVDMLYANRLRFEKEELYSSLLQCLSRYAILRA